MGIVISYASPHATRESEEALQRRLRRIIRMVKQGRSTVRVRKLYGDDMIDLTETRLQRR